MHEESLMKEVRAINDLQHDIIRMEKEEKVKLKITIGILVATNVLSVVALLLEVFGI